MRNNHKQLIAEMEKMNKLPMRQRLAVAKTRRAEQLNWYNNMEKKESAASDQPGRTGSKKSLKNRQSKIKFEMTSLLFDAVSNGDVEEVRSLITSGRCDKDATNCNGMTALHQSCANHNLGLIHVLVKEFSADLSKPDLELWTPLHTVAFLGFADVTRFLLDNGADPLALNLDSSMPYDICEDPDTLDIIERNMESKCVTQDVIEHIRAVKENNMLNDLQIAFCAGENLTYQGENGESLLHVATALDYKEVVKFLLKTASFNVEVVDKDGWQPIHCAAYWNQYDIAEILLDHGADVQSRTYDDETALDLCRDPLMKDWMMNNATKAKRTAMPDSKRLFCRRPSSDKNMPHFDSTVSPTDLNKLSITFKRLMPEKKKEKKKQELKSEFESLMSSELDLNEESFTFENSKKPKRMNSCPKILINIPQDVKEEEEYSPGFRPGSSYKAIYNNQAGRFNYLDSPEVLLNKENSFKKLRVPGTPVSPMPPTPTRENSQFLFPNDSPRDKSNTTVINERKPSFDFDSVDTHAQRLNSVSSNGLPRVKLNESKAPAVSDEYNGLLRTHPDQTGMPPRRFNSVTDMPKIYGTPGRYSADTANDRCDSHGSDNGGKKSLRKSLDMGTVTQKKRESKSSKKKSKSGRTSGKCVVS